jgi:hypothetical protein
VKEEELAEHGVNGWSLSKWSPAFNLMKKKISLYAINSSGRYSVQSFYVMVNDRGVKQMFTSVV